MTVPNKPINKDTMPPLNKENGTRNDAEGFVEDGPIKMEES